MLECIYAEGSYLKGWVSLMFSDSSARVKSCLCGSCLWRVYLQLVYLRWTHLKASLLNWLLQHGSIDSTAGSTSSTRIQDLLTDTSPASCCTSYQPHPWHYLVKASMNYSWSFIPTLTKRGTGRTPIHLKQDRFAKHFLFSLNVIRISVFNMFL